MKILITSRIHTDGLKKLRENDVSFDILNQVELLQDSVSDYDGLITMLSDNMSQKFLDKNKHLKVISNYAVGFNNIDLKTATKNNIKIGNTPDVLTDATAELTMALILATTRNLKAAWQNVSTGNWNRWEPLAFLGMELSGKTLGIIGLGRIGKAVAKRAYCGFNMKISYFHPTKTDIESNYQYVSFKTLLQTSDIISIHCPLNNKTKNMVNFNFINQMKQGSFFINTARGNIHSEEALLNGLNSGQLKGVGLDVTNPEPMQPSSKLLAHPQAIILPHIGSATNEARRLMSLICAENIINGLKGLELKCGLN